MELIITAHKEAAVKRIREHKVVLAVQDTTVLNHSAYLPDDADPVNMTKDTARGFLLHDTVAFAEDGLPLGVLDAQFWARNPAAARQSAARRERDIEEKESSKWLKSYRAAAEVQALCPDTMIVSVGDRESDIYELFHEAR